MMKLLTRYFLTLSIVFLYSCAGSQPMPESGTKDKKAQNLLMTAINYFKAGQDEMALKTVEDAIKKDDKYIDAILFKADVLALLKRYDESVKAYDRVLEVNPNYTMAWFGKGKVLFALGKYDEAKAAIKKFMETPKIPDERLRDCNRILANCDFAPIAIKNPVPYNPVNLGKAVNSKFDDYFPSLTADEQTLIFTRLLGNQEDFFYSNQKDSIWQPAINLGGPVNTPENEGFASISADGQYLFFAACQRPDSKGSCDLYFSKLDGDKWKPAINMQNPVNTSAWESQPSLSFDGKTIYFASNRPGGYGGIDIWKTTFENNHFTEPENLGPDINTYFDEQCPYIATDNRTLYFSSNGWPGMGDIDLYYSKMNDSGKWTKPVNLGYPINTMSKEICMSINRNGSKAFISSDVDSGFGGLDIYGFDLYKEARPEPSSYVKGDVFDAETKAKLEASIELIDLSTGKTVIYAKSNKKTGQFLVVLQSNNNYALNVSAEGYLFHSENFSLKESPANNPFILSIGLNKVKEGQKLVLNNVFFDVNASTLKNESKIELDKLAAFLTASPKVKIEIGGHTDNTGTRVKNQELSLNRAKSVYDYLVSKGIDKARLSYKGYGDTQPVAPNTTEDGRRQNRRTEVTITGN